MAVSACAVSIACCGGCAQKQRAEAPEPVVFRAGDDRGRVLLPESFDGRIVVLAFLDGPAGGNRQAAPYIERLHDRFAADNRVLVVAVGDRTVLGLSARSGLTVMPEAPDLADRFGVIGAPHVVVLDPTGAVAYRTRGYDAASMHGLAGRVDALLRAEDELLGRPAAERRGG